MVALANAERLGWEAIAAALAPPPPVDFIAWAVSNIEFSKRESPSEPGPYNPRRFSYFSEILRALSPSDPCRTVTLAKSAQLGGTVLANIFTLGSMQMDPGDFMYVHPTEENAKRWSKLKLRPMLKGNEKLKDLFPEKSRDGSDSTLFKERVDGLGSILISGANSGASLSMVTMPRQVQDDLSKWTKNSAGDPEVQADSRSRGVAFAKIFKISTPLIEPGCRITKNFRAGSQERPFVPCPHCGHMQVLEWTNMLACLDEDRPEEAHFTCVAEGCEQPIREKHRAAILPKVEWRAANPKMKRLHRSFYLWSAYSFLQSWAQIALEWLKAKGDSEAERVFLNDTVGLAFEARGESPPWEGLRDRAAESTYDRGTVPAGGLLLTMGIDCQKDRVEWQKVAWGREIRRYVVEYGVVPFHISDPRCHVLLSAHVEQPSPTASGGSLPVELAAIDGNAYTEDVWAWAKQHPVSRVIMVRGDNRDGAPLLSRVSKERDRQGKLLSYSKRFYNFSASSMKMWLYRNLAVERPEDRGYVAFPRGMEDEYFRQLTAERRIGIKRGGQEVFRWVPDPGQANEGLDTMNQAEAAAIRLGLRAMSDALWARREAALAASTPPAPAVDQTTTPATPVPPTTPAAAPAAPTSLRPTPRRGIGALAARLNGLG